MTDDVRILKTWHGAKDYCALQGGHLVTIQSSTENRFVYDLAIEGNIDVGTWLGGTDEEKEGTWVWVTGEEWKYQNWLQDQGAKQFQPDDIAGNPNPLVYGADYLTFDFWEKTWHDWSGDSQMFFVCEWEPAP